MTNAPTFERERELAERGFHHVAGVDEAGRGPLAGPVVAAAIVLPPGFSSPHFHLLNDSKQLKENLREVLFEELKARVAFGIGIVEAAEIDSINIRQASWRAMQIAVADLTTKSTPLFGRTFPDYVLIDGLSYGEGPFEYEAIVKGDAKSLSIAAASVVAKVVRDDVMRKLDARFPLYGFAQHKGYGTAQHLRALEEHGVCSEHRKTFAPVRRVLEFSRELSTSGGDEA